MGNAPRMAHGTNSINYVTNATPNANTYIVQEGDTMSSIATALGVELGELEAINPDAGHPPGNFDVIYPGDKLNIPSDNSGSVGGGTPILAGFKRLVATCPVTITNNGSDLTTVTVPHGLSFIPLVEGSIDDASDTIESGPVTGVSVAFPTIQQAVVSGGVVQVPILIYALSDATNIYVNLLNATGSPVSYSITCYLYQRIL